MKLLFTNEDEDIKFALSYTHPEITVENSNTTVLSTGDGEYTGVSEVLKYFLKDDKKVKEALRIKTSCEQVKSSDQLIRLIGLHNALKSFMISPQLKNKDYLKGLLAEFGFEDQLFYLMDIRVGKMASLEEVSGSDKLFVEQVEFKSQAQIVSGLRGRYSKKDLEGNKFLFITNIKKSKIMGIESQGMILCGKDESGFSAFEIDEGVDCGQVCILENKPCIVTLGAISKIDLKKEFYSQIFGKLAVKNGQLMFNDVVVTINGSPVKSKIANGIVS